MTWNCHQCVACTDLGDIHTHTHIHTHIHNPNQEKPEESHGQQNMGLERDPRGERGVVDPVCGGGVAAAAEFKVGDRRCCAVY